MDFDISVTDQTDSDYEIRDNFAENLVDAIRSDMVGNEEPYLLMHFSYATGLSPIVDHYNAVEVGGPSGSGKSALKQLVDERWPNHWMLRLTDMSDKGAIDDTRWNNRYILSGDEWQKLPANAIEILKSCVTPDHDVLTPNGLVAVDELEAGDEVISWNKDTYETEVKEVEEMVRYPEYRGPLLDIETRDVSVAMSPNHRVPVSIGQRGKNAYTEMRADEADEYQQFQLPSGKHGIVPAAGDTPETVDIVDWYDGEVERNRDGARPALDGGHHFCNTTFDTENFVKLMAWYITEGSSYHVDGETYNVTISQKDDTHVAPLLDEMGIRHSAHDKGDGNMNYTIGSKIFHDVLTSLCGDDSGSKQIPEWVFGLDAETRQTFLDTLMLGDGDTKETSHRYTTSSETLRDDVLRLAFSLGITANYSTETYDKESHNDTYRVRCNTDWENVGADDRTWATADDGIYCPVVEDNKSFVVCRNGKLSVTLNTFGDDADEEGWGYKYVRNTSQQQGDDHEEKKKQVMPFITLIADENEMKGSDTELGTRTMTVRVEDDEDLNEGVSATKWDHTNVQVEGKSHEYEYFFQEGKNVIDHHIANIPRHPYQRDNVPDGWATNQQYASPVIIPHDESIDWPTHVGKRGWDAHKVAKPMFEFKRTESKRASKTVASLVRGSTLLNYHERETVELNGFEWYVAEPQDLGNVIACRSTLLGLTHNFDEKKMAVVRALTDPENGVGGAGPTGGVAAPIRDINEYIEDYADITSVSESHLRNKILADMADRFLITIHENEGENGAHLYEYHGGSTFGQPNIGEYPELFEDVTDPIRDQPIAQTIDDVADQLQSNRSESILNGSTDGLSGAMSGSSSEDDADDSDDGEGLSAFGGGVEEDDDAELDETEQLVAEALKETLDDLRIEDGHGLETSHMVGASPLNHYSGDKGLQYVEAERPLNDGDKKDTILDNDHPHWGAISENKVQSRVEAAIASLAEKGVFQRDTRGEDDGTAYIIVDY